MSEHAPGAAFNANAADTTDAAVVFEVPIAPMVTTQRHLAAIPRKREGSPLRSNRVSCAMPTGSAPKKKPRSSHAFDQPPTEEADRMSMREGDEAMKFIRDLPYSGEEKDYLLGYLHSRTMPPWGTVGNRLAVLGDTGGGKSKTIISIVDLDLGTASGGSDSVTNVIIEYRSCYHDQKTPLLAQVFFFPECQVWDAILDGLREFREWQAAQPDLNEDDAEEDDDDYDDDDAGVESQEPPTRLTTKMKHLFPSKFPQTTDVRKFLEKNNDADVLQFILEGIRKILKAMMGSDGLRSKIEKGCSTADAVKKFIDPYIRKGYVPFAEGEEYYCWPYSLVQKVVIAFDSEALHRKGNIVTDSPGVGDSNKSNVDRAYVALKDADKIMVVQEMKRCTAKESFHKILRHGCKRRGPENTFVVLTHSADIDDIRDEIRQRLPQRDRSKHDNLQQNIRQIMHDLHRLEKQEKEEPEMAARRRLQEQMRSKEEQKTRFEKRCFELLVDCNNRYITGRLRSVVQGKTWWKSDYPELVVFCIDNQEHEKFLNKTKGNPRLSYEATGVPALRRYIANFPSEGLWQTLKHHLESTWDSTFHSLEMTGTITKAQTKAQITEHFNKMYQDTLTGVEEQYETLKKDIEKLKDSLVENEKAWVKEGVDRYSSFINHWNMRSSTHTSLMKKCGYTRTSKGDELDLNETLHEVVQETVLGHVENLRDEKLKELGQNLMHIINTSLLSTLNEIEHGPQYDSVGFTSHVVRGLRIRQRELETACTSSRKATIKKIVDMRDRVLETQVENESYWSIASRAAYDSAMKAKPTRKIRTVFLARRKAFERAIRGRDGPYHRFCTIVFDELIKILEIQRAKFIENMNAIFNEIQREINRACTRSDDESKEAAAFREAVVSYTKDMRKRFDNDIRPKLKESMAMAEEAEKKEIAEAEQAIANSDQTL